MQVLMLSLLQPRESGYFSLLDLLPLPYLTLSPQNSVYHCSPSPDSPALFLTYIFYVLFILAASLGIHHFTVAATEKLSATYRRPWCLQQTN